MNQFIHEELLRSQEQYTIEDNIIVSISTFNVCQQPPPPGFIELIVPMTGNDPLPQIVVISLAEVDKTINGNDESLYDEWTQYLIQGMPQFKLQSAQKAAGTSLFVFSSVELQYQATVSKRLTYGCKGVLGFSCTIGSSSLLFIASHLMHGKEKCQIRNQQFFEITLNYLDFQPIDRHPVTLMPVPFHRHVYKHDSVFWLGDLNYRPDAKFKSSTPLTPIQFDYQKLMEFEQLHKVIVNKKAFVNFDEQRITFAPTYKFSKPAEYDSERVPAWCDRILFYENTDKYDIKPQDTEQITLSALDNAESLKCDDETTDNDEVFDWNNKDDQHPNYTGDVHSMFQHDPTRKERNIKGLGYVSLDQINVSDHKPVLGLFQLTFKKIVREKRDVLLKSLCAQYQEKLDKFTPVIYADQQLDFGHVYLNQQLSKTITLTVSNCTNPKLEFYAPEAIKKYVSFEPLQSQNSIQLKVQLKLSVEFVQSRQAVAFQDEFNTFSVCVRAINDSFGVSIQSDKQIQLKFNLNKTPLGLKLEELQMYSLEQLKVIEIEDSNDKGGSKKIILCEFSGNGIIQTQAIPKIIQQLMFNVMNNLNAQITNERDFILLKVIICGLQMPLLSNQNKTLLSLAKQPSDLANIFQVFKMQNKLEHRVISKLTELGNEIYARSITYHLKPEAEMQFKEQICKQFASMLFGDNVNGEKTIKMLFEAPFNIKKDLFWV
ncbi:4 [Hexamita inflata]|uniref:4 n=1 Tax=Hexamita inflata TaxID=28002 RepID=A0AA86N5M3_9EUKA|nr:4 [Hexamita inflata] [Hexamita inflata]